MDKTVDPAVLALREKCGYKRNMSDEERKQYRLRMIEEHERKVKEEIRETQRSLFPDVIPEPPRKDTGIVNNNIARSAVFAPRQKGNRKIQQDAIVPSWTGTTIHFSGPFLDMGDHDTFLAAMMCAAGSKPNVPVHTSRFQFLKFIRRQPGGKTYKWLEASLDRLSGSRIKISTTSGDFQIYNFLVNPGVKNDTLQFIIPEDTMAYFEPNNYTYIELKKRFAITKNQQLGKWLHGFICTHRAGQMSYLSVDKFRELTQSCEKRKDRFVKKLMDTAEELKTLGELQKYDLKDNIFSWMRPAKDIYIP